jgi:hypothetical protein
MNMLEHAFEYANRGWAVFPLFEIQGGQCACRKDRCSSAGKHPRVTGGHKAATTDEETIRQWWTEWPEANIGIATGQTSSLLVIDVDQGPNKDGYANIAALEASNGSLPKDLTVLTGSGGRHIYLAMPDANIRNSAGQLAPHIDVCGEGGYVVAPPSLHISGNRYTWENTNE